MSKHLLIVESPTKAKTIKRYVGEDFTVKASVGHVKDLPKNRMGVNVGDGFAVELEVIHGKSKILSELRAAAKKAKDVLLAPDPDREGEAIAWHIADEVRKVNPSIYRVTFNEITRHAVQEALGHPRALDQHLYDAQQARRVLDRLVGYEISPLLWDKVRRGLSAGRVQSVALRLVVEREREIEAFVPQEYWSIEEKLGRVDGQGAHFLASLAKIGGEKAQIGSREAAERIQAELGAAAHRVLSIERKERSRRPYPPYITSTLQQAAAAVLHYPAKKTMRIAQQLYEGVELAGEGAVGLITYMRTDSTRVADSAIEQVRGFIAERFGKDQLPETAQIYKTKKDAQDAHEAIRPTEVIYTPEKIKESLSPEQFKIYDLIWRRFVASQMLPARFDQTTVTVSAGPYELRSTGSVCAFPGWLQVAKDQSEDDPEASFPALAEGDALAVAEVVPDQHFTQPPPRFSEGTLVKELEEDGIGRPSTYATIIDTIVSKHYVEKLQGRLHPTELGRIVTDLLVQSFPVIMDVAFTADMERKLDEVEDGRVDWVALMRDFYGPFAETMEKARKEMRDVKREEVKTEHHCELCGKEMVIKWGRNGYFLACSGYPECKNTKEIKSRAGGKVEIAPAETTDEVCDKCGLPMVVKRGRFGRFLACSGYPTCKTSRPIPIGITCPACKVGRLVERRSRKGRFFFACDKYPDCKFSTWDRPVNQPCPTCGFPIMVHKVSKKEGELLACPIKTCGHKQSLEQAGEPSDESTPS